MVASRSEAARNAEAARSNIPGTCQLWTRIQYGAPSAGDVDRDGDSDAVDGWKKEPVSARHPGDRNPPRGVPVAFSGGSRGYGHRAVSLGGGKIRSTDMTATRYSPGVVGTTTIDQIERSMGVTYLGWSETITGTLIPDDTKPVTKPKPRRRKRIFRVGVINIPTKVGPNAWRKCWEEAADRCGIFGVNEAFHPKAKALYLELAKEHGYGQYGTRRGPNPIYFNRKRWRRVSGTVHKIHGRGNLFARWPGFNEARYVTDLVLVPRGRPDALEVAVLCTHWVPNGRKVSGSFRDKARVQSRLFVERLVREHQAAGRIVYLIGDTNIAKPFTLGIRGFQWIRGKGIDKVGVAVPKGYVLGKTSVDVFDAPTDHRHGVATAAQITKENR